MRRRCFIYLAFHLLGISSTGCFINWMFHQLDISLTRHFINRTFHRSDISLTGHFTNWAFHQPDISLTRHFTDQTFHQLDISLTWHFTIPFLGHFPALPANRLFWRGLPRTNTPAYCVHCWILAIKSFIKLGPSFSSEHKNELNKLECCITLGWKASPVTNTLAYWLHL
jgi:hypothetical protein